MAKARPLTDEEKAEGGRYGRPYTTSDSMPETRRDNEARQDNAFSAYGLAQKIKARQKRYDNEE